MDFAYWQVGLTGTEQEDLFNWIDAGFDDVAVAQERDVVRTTVHSSVGIALRMTRQTIDKGISPRAPLSVVHQRAIGLLGEGDLADRARQLGVSEQRAGRLAQYLELMGDQEFPNQPAAIRAIATQHGIAYETAYLDIQEALRILSRIAEGKMPQGRRGRPRTSR